MPSTATTIGLRSSARAGIEPVSRRAARRPSRIGDSHRSCSSVASAAGNDSATGPGPNTVPLAGPIVVIGRACSRCSRPSAVTAHSMSCGAAVRPGDLPGERGEAAEQSARRTRPSPVPSAPHGPDRGGRARRSSRRRRRRPAGPAHHRRRRRGTGRGGRSSGRRRTARRPTAASIIGCTSTAIVASTRPASRAAAAEPTTASTATRKRSSSPTSNTDSNTPAIDDPPPSSPVDDDRTTTRCAPSSERRRHASVATSASAGLQLVVNTTPGSAGRPATWARARLAALAPTSAGSTARGSSSATTVGKADMTTPSRPALAAR